MTAIRDAHRRMRDLIVSVPAALAVCVASYAVAADKNDVTLTLGANPAITLQHVLPAFGGMLLGFDGGEWGGGLVFIDAEGRARQVGDDNVNGLARSGTRIFTFTGHHYENEGIIQEVKPGSSGRLEANKIRNLPGYPSDVRQVDARTIAFRVFAGYAADNRAIYHCIAFDGNAFALSKRCMHAPD